MSVCYNNLWKLLIDKEMKRTDLVLFAGISTNTLAKMGRNESVSIESLEKICTTLDCDIGDIVEINNRYSNESENKSNGVVYTPKRMAEYLANSMLMYSDLSANDVVSIIDPAIGDGELVMALLSFLHSKEINARVVGFDIDDNAIERTKKRITSDFPDVGLEIINGDFLEFVPRLIKEERKFDYVIANPPYIRTQILGSSKSKKLSEILNLKGRIDIYYAFLVASVQVLAPKGVAGFITSNKFMTVLAGKSVRDRLLRNTSLRCITDFGDTKVFDASVLPCTIIYTNGETDPDSVLFKSIYEVPKTEDASIVQDVFDHIDEAGTFCVSGGRCYEVKIGTLKAAADGSPWAMNSVQLDDWLFEVERATKMKFKDIGKIRVGIKTTADNVFIGKDWEDEPIELLRPLITHRNSGQIIPGNQTLWKVLYPHSTAEGRRICVDLDKYPKSKEYLNKHRVQLEAREYLKKANRRWYEIWVPQNPDSWANRKIVFRDISEKPQFWLDETGAVVNGDCYWIDIDRKTPDDLVYLALAVANSTFIERYYDALFNNKIYSGKRRYMSQYVEQFPIPDCTSPLSKRAISIVKSILNSSENDTCDLKKELDITIDYIFGLSKKSSGSLS